MGLVSASSYSTLCRICAPYFDCEFSLDILLVVDPGGASFFHRMIILSWPELLYFCRATWLISIGDVMLSVLFFPGLFKCFCVLAIFDLTTKPCQLTIYICSFILTSKQIMHSNKSSFLHNTEYQAASKWDRTTIPTSNGGNLTLFISSIQMVLLSRIP